MNAISLTPADALIVVDMQNDFLPGGALGVPRGDEVIEPIRHLIDMYRGQGLPVYVTRDWHPEDHCSFTEQGGPWPPHCVAGTQGAEFSSAFDLRDGVTIISKATTAPVDAYSAFNGTDLAEQLRNKHVDRVTVCGLATDYCVLNTVLDALELQFKVALVPEAARAVDVSPGDGERAIDRMIELGANPVQLDRIQQMNAPSKAELAR